VRKYLKFISNLEWRSCTIRDYRLEGERFKSPLYLKILLCVVDDMTAYVFAHINLIIHCLQYLYSKPWKLFMHPFKTPGNSSMYQGKQMKYSHVSNGKNSMEK
jgi:hypothetical protein